MSSSDDSNMSKLNEVEEKLFMKACTSLQKQVADMKESTMLLQLKKFYRMKEKKKSKEEAVGKKASNVNEID